MMMEQEKLESMLIDYIDGNLNAIDTQIVEEELGKSQEAMKLYRQLKELMGKMEQSEELIPGEALKTSFEQLLAQEIAKKPEGKSVILIPMFYRIAATVTLLMVASITGYWIYKDRQYQKELTELKREVETTKLDMMSKLGNDQSASQRMMGVSVAYEMNKPDDEIVNVLIRTMNSDPNTNVRLAALDALGKFHEEDNVRRSLIEALSTQKDPVVQIALIQLMVKMKEKNIVKQLEKMTRDSKTMKAVKDEAYTGIMKLS